MPAFNSTKGAGVALLCDEAGIIQQVLRDDLGLTEELRLGTTPVSELIAPVDPKDVMALLGEVRTQAASFDWTLNVNVSGEVQPLHIAAGRVDSRILFVGELSSEGIALRFYEEMMQVNNDQVNALRAALKQKVVLTRRLQTHEQESQHLYDELSALNNELVNLQRELGKKNIELQAKEMALREYADNLEQRVAEKVRELDVERAKAIQMDKMASLGQMATGVAHELNQPLTAISFEADYLKTVVRKAQEQGRDYSELLSGDELHAIGKNLVGDVARCRRIIDHLRAFGRVSEAEPQPIDLNQPIEAALILVGARLREHNITVHLDLAPKLPPVLGDPHRLEQVFLNLITNAEYALQKRAEREQAATGAAAPMILRLVTAEDGREVVARVIDNGAGMSEETLAHLFEPFYTTKPVGEGTGLGLSISYGIVTECGGSIAAESAPGAGTTFELRFPVAGE